MEENKKITSKELKLLETTFSNFDKNVFNNPEQIKPFIALSEKLSKEKIILPFQVVLEISRNGALQDFAENCDFRFIQNEYPNFSTLLSSQSTSECLHILKFAKALGCFSKERILDKNGTESQTLLAQKASSLFAQILTTQAIEAGKFQYLIYKLSFKQKPNQEFVEFLSMTEKKQLKNLKLLLNLDKEAHGIFVKVMSNFDKAIKFKKTIGKNGNPITLSWEKTFEKFYLNASYNNVSEENKDIANLFISKGIYELYFQQACKLRDEAKANNVPHHILGKPLKEESKLSKIEKTKSQTGKVIDRSKENLDRLFNNQFTYEMLDKYDPHNAIIGIYTSCCATISNHEYGKIIVDASITAPDVQNLIVRDARGEIVAKGTLYINQKFGYGVINEFDINEKYKQHEKDRESGFYMVFPDHPDEKERQAIFNALMRGIKAFAQEYDKSHPDRPLLKVNVGLGLNRLKRQCLEFKKATTNLLVPPDYSFSDAQVEQITLYDREEMLAKKAEYENSI